MWVWIVVGLGPFLGLSLLVGIAMARIFGAIGQQISELYETENWATLPPTRASRKAREQQPDEAEAESSRVSRLR
jgi:hypothetical protein